MRGSTSSRPLLTTRISSARASTSSISPRRPRPCTRGIRGISRHRPWKPRSASVQKFDNPWNASATYQNDPVKAERANYFDAGINQRLAKGLRVGVDGYYNKPGTNSTTVSSGKRSSCRLSTTRRGRFWGGVHDHLRRRRVLDLRQRRLFCRQGKGLGFRPVPVRPGGRGLRPGPVDCPGPRPTGHRFLRGLLSLETRRRQFAILRGRALRQRAQTDATATDGSNIPNGGTVPAYYTIGIGFEEALRSTGRTGSKRDWMSSTSPTTSMSCAMAAVSGSMPPVTACAWACLARSAISSNVPP